MASPAGNSQSQASKVRGHDDNQRTEPPQAQESDTIRQLRDKVHQLQQSQKKTFASYVKDVLTVGAIDVQFEAGRSGSFQMKMSGSLYRRSNRELRFFKVIDWRPEILLAFATSMAPLPDQVFSKATESSMLVEVITKNKNASEAFLMDYISGEMLERLKRDCDSFSTQEMEIIIEDLQLMEVAAISLGEADFDALRKKAIQKVESIKEINDSKARRDILREGLVQSAFFNAEKKDGKLEAAVMQRSLPSTIDRSYNTTNVHIENLYMTDIGKTSSSSEGEHQKMLTQPILARVLKSLGVSEEGSVDVPTVSDTKIEKNETRKIKDEIEKLRWRVDYLENPTSIFAVHSDQDTAEGVEMMSYGPKEEATQQELSKMDMVRKALAPLLSPQVTDDLYRSFSKDRNPEVFLNDIKATSGWPEKVNAVFAELQEEESFNPTALSKYFEANGQIDYHKLVENLINDDTQ